MAGASIGIWRRTLAIRNERPMLFRHRARGARWAHRIGRAKNEPSRNDYRLRRDFGRIDPRFIAWVSASEH